MVIMKYVFTHKFKYKIIYGDTSSIAHVIEFLYSKKCN